MPELRGSQIKSNGLTTKLDYLITLMTCVHTKSSRSFYKNKCRNACNNYLANTLNSHSGSMRLWSYIKSKKKYLTGVAPICYNDQVYTDNQDKANF